MHVACQGDAFERDVKKTSYNNIFCVMTFTESLTDGAHAFHLDAAASSPNSSQGRSGDPARRRMGGAGRLGEIARLA